MVGYVRQSVADILPGEEIRAEPLNAEFNRLQSAFGGTGHTHDGTLGNAPKIDLTTSVVGILPSENGGIGGRNNTTATVAPKNTDDSSKGYIPGSIWVNTTTRQAYICVSAQVGNAVWNLLETATGTYLLTGNNLSDVPDKSVARTNLGLTIGTNVQAFNEALATLSAATSTNFNRVPFVNASNNYSFFITTQFSRDLMSNANANTWKTSLGLERVNNTNDLEKPISTAVSNALNTLASKTADNTLTGVNIFKVIQQAVVNKGPTSANGTITFDFMDGNKQYIEVLNTITFALNNLPSDGSGDLEVMFTYTSGSIVFPSGVVWSKGDGTKTTNFGDLGITLTTNQRYRVIFQYVGGQIHGVIS